MADVFKLDKITPGHVRRDTDTRQPVMPTAQGDIDPDLETDGINDTEDDMSGRSQWSNLLGHYKTNLLYLINIHEAATVSLVHSRNSPVS